MLQLFSYINTYTMKNLATFLCVIIMQFHYSSCEYKKIPVIVNLHYKPKKMYATVTLQWRKQYY